jgi:hypothetical protein
MAGAIQRRTTNDDRACIRATVYRRPSAVVFALAASDLYLGAEFHDAVGGEAEEGGGCLGVSGH